MNEERQRLIERSVTKMPTPTTRDWKGSVAAIFPNAGEPGKEEVKQMAKEYKESEKCKYPTPSCTGMAGGTGSCKRLQQLKDSGTITEDEKQALQRGWPGGKLNPDWVEWLMGWPIGWTALRPLETVRFPLAPQPRS